MLTVGVAVISGVTIYLLQESKIKSLRAQLAAQQTNQARPSQPTRPPPMAVPRTDPNAFAAIAESAIPGRYRWVKGEQEKGVVTLNPDHTFANEKGERFRVYRWELSPEGLMLNWQRGPVLFTIIEAPGVYVAVR